MLVKCLFLISCGFLLLADQVVLGQFLGVRSNFCFVDAFMGYKKEVKRAFDQINEHLTREVKSDDIETNMQEIREWIDEKDNDPHPTGRAGLLKALMQLDALSDKERPGELCTLSSRAAILENFRMAGVCLDQKTLSSKDFKPTRRIEKIIFHYAKKMAAECHEKHLMDYKNRYIFMASETKERVSKFIGDMIIKRLQSQPNYSSRLKLSRPDEVFEKAPVEVSRFTWSINKRDAKTAMQWLTAFTTAANDLRGRFLSKANSMGRRKTSDLNEGDFKYLSYEYLYRPCYDFNFKLREAFERDTEIDIFYEPSSKDPDELQKDYYRDLTLYSGCQKYMKEHDWVVREMLRLKRNEMG